MQEGVHKHSWLARSVLDVISSIQLCVVSSCASSVLCVSVKIYCPPTGTVTPGCLSETDVAEQDPRLPWSLMYWSCFFNLIGDYIDISQILLSKNTE